MQEVAGNYTPSPEGSYEFMKVQSKGAITVDQNKDQQDQTISSGRRTEEGFTLIELLITIIILGILASVVVFAVGGINDRGEESACTIDTRTLQTAQEAHWAKNSAYAANEGALVTAGFLSEESSYHDITDFVAPTAGTDPGSYKIRVRDTKCGVATPGASGNDDLVDKDHPNNH